MFDQNVEEKPLRDFIFPVGSISENRLTLQGTAFFIGDRGFAVTSAHVAEELRRLGSSVGLFASKDGTWTVVNIIDYELHNSEDIAIIKVQGYRWHSICQLISTKSFASCEYELWGYPDKVSNELNVYSNVDEDDKIVRPDLVYNKGYVRRLISREMPTAYLRGMAFYEISEVAGACCSGSPLIQKPRNVGPFPVFGLYVGESTGDRLFAVGYALRMEAIKDWAPKILGKRLVEIAASLS